MMNAKQMWEKFLDKEAGDSYDAWQYGSHANGLALLTLLKIKTATSSAYPIYVQYDEPLPQVGSYSIILDKQDHAVCIIQTTEVTIIPFDQVNDEHAYLEGEGDRTLDYWRKIHADFFTQEMENMGQQFHKDMLVVCEKFKVIYPKS